jgi:hypothetical protein
MSILDGRRAPARRAPRRRARRPARSGATLNDHDLVFCSDEIRPALTKGATAMDKILKAKRKSAGRPSGERLPGWLPKDRKEPRNDPKPLLTSKFWSGRRDLNPRPLDPQSSALPSCATSRNRPSAIAGGLVYLSATKPPPAHADAQHHPAALAEVQDRTPGKGGAGIGRGVPAAPGSRGGGDRLPVTAARLPFPVRQK